MMAKHVTFRAGIVVVAALALTSPLFAQTADAPQVAETAMPEAGADTVVATVNGTDITLGHMIVLRNNLPAQYQQLANDVLFKGILEQLVQQTALAQSVEPRMTLQDRIAIENDTRGYLSGIALAEVVTAAVTDEALQKAYEGKFTEEKKEYNAAHILVPTLEEAQKLKAEIDAGADFAAVAKAHSSDGAAANGGDLGWYSAGMMVQPFQDAVFAMAAGQVSDPVQTQFGWHLIQLKETRIAAAPSLDDMREELAGEIEQAAIEAHIKEVVASAKVERPGDAMNPDILGAAIALDK
jgi:peptidyl-prolyl cis-trans isomerase C